MVGSIATPSSDAEGMLVGPVAVADAGLKSYQELKESDVSWLGKVPAHWEVRHLGRIGRFFKGGGGTKEDEREDGIPCVRYGDLYTYHRFFITASRTCVAPDLAATVYTPIRYGDVLFAASGETIDEIGKSAVNLMQSEACCGGDVILFRPERQVEARYMGYATDCRPAAAQKATMGRGITVKHIYGDQLKYLTLALPPLSEQAAIVRYLDHVDRRIRRYIGAKKKLIKLLEEQKQAFIHRAVTRGLDPNVRLKPSGMEWLGDVPEHWTTERLKSSMNNVVEQTTERRGADLYVALEHVESWTGRLRHAALDVSFDSQVKYFRSGDVLFGKLRPYLAKVTRPTSDGVCVGEFLVLRPRHAHATAAYMEQLLRSKPIIDAVNGSTFGAKMPRADWQFMGGMAVALPPLPEQAAIVAYLDKATADIDTTIDRARRKIELLGEYRTRLIADVVTGKLDVHEAAARLPDERERRPEPYGQAAGPESRGETGSPAGEADRL